MRGPTSGGAEKALRSKVSGQRPRSGPGGMPTRLTKEVAEIRSRRGRLPCISSRPEPAAAFAPEPIEVYLARQAEEHRRIAQELVISPRRPRRRR